MYTALITDLDGTAVAISSNGDDIDAATKQAVQRAIAAGKKLTCASGRSWYSVKPVVAHLGFVSPCIIEGGSRIIDPHSEKTLWEKSLQPGVAQEIFAVFKSESSVGTLMTPESVQLKPLHTVKSVPNDLRFIYLLAIPAATARKIRRLVNARHDAVAHCTPSWDGGSLIDVHVTHPEATKEQAIHVWQRLEGVSRAETIGLGDSGNDIPIFRSAGFKVAVDNATAELKELADYIAPHVDDHALQYIIDKFLLD